VIVYGIVFMLSIATVSFRDLFGLSVLNVAFNTTAPTFILTSTAMTVVLYWGCPKGRQRLVELQILVVRPCCCTARSSPS
jgi:hypothetical protein